jgi:seryl-tRNA synthetase
METKEQLIQVVKEWVTMDNEIRKHQRLVREMKTKQKNVSQQLMTTMKQNEIECFDINNGSLVYKKNKVKKPINKNTLYSILNDYFKGNTEHVEDLGKYIMDNRQEVVKETIQRKIDNK